MTKILTSLGVCSLFLVSVVLAQPLTPTENYDVGGEEMSFEPVLQETQGEVQDSISSETQVADGYSFKVFNVSQQNSDAEVSGARIGDVLRYEFIIDSPKNDVVNFVTSLNINDIINSAEIVDSGLGNINEGVITFPAFTQQAPCKKVFSFFARIKDCTGDKNLTASGHNQSVTVPLNCELAKSGPSSKMIMYLTLGVVSFIMLGLLRKRKQL